MKYLTNKHFLLLLIMVLVLSIATAMANLQQQHDNYYNFAADQEEEEDDDDINDIATISETRQASTINVSDHETEGRSLLQKKRHRKLTCNKSPKICRAKGSPGPKCCKKKCVNVLMDRQNCGKCGKKCKYNEICCKGKCVNPSFSKNHCGGCNNRCDNGELCLFGLCNYA